MSNTLKYGKIASISKRLESRISVVDSTDYGLTGITGTQIGTDLIYIVGSGIEEFADMFLGMIYQMPLVNEHPYLQSIVEKLIVSDIYITYFPTQSEASDSTDSYSSVLRQQALNEFQVLFDGLGIFVPGASNASNQLQNDESKQQLTVRPLILRGETLKDSIGYDFDGDSITDTDLYKLNANVQPSFYMPGNFEKLEEGDYGVRNGVRVRQRRTYYNPSRAEIDFW
jgi:hypothetical protein